MHVLLNVITVYKPILWSIFHKEIFKVFLRKPYLTPKNVCQAIAAGTIRENSILQMLFFYPRCLLCGCSRVALRPSLTRTRQPVLTNITCHFPVKPDVLLNTGRKTAATGFYVFHVQALTKSWTTILKNRRSLVWFHAKPMTALSS